MKFVAVFASSPTLTHFCRTEFLTVARTFGVDVTPVVAPLLDGSNDKEANPLHWLVNGAHDDTDDPFFVFESQATLPAVEAMAQRCVLLRSIHILLQAAPSLDALYTWREQHLPLVDAEDDEPSSPSSPSPSSAVDKKQASASTSAATVVVGEEEAQFAMDDYAYTVETTGKRYAEGDKHAILHRVGARNAALRGNHVNWQCPKRRFLVLIQHETQAAPPGAKRWEPNGPILRVFHVVAFCTGGRLDLLARYDLKKRPYIGTTSMPPEESILLANFAGVQPGYFVMDPFCGTGSLLVAAAQAGAHTFGADADGRAMRAGTRKGAASPQLQQQRQLALSVYTEAQLASLSPEERVLPTMRTNFTLYQLPPPDCARMNFSAWQTAWRRDSGPIFDAILSDPPYGLREPRKKVVTGPAETGEQQAGAASKEQPSGTSSHPPQRQGQLAEYSTDEVVLDLVLFAAEHLAVGGRLAFWHPTTDHYTDDELPTHPSLQLRTNLPQRLSLKFVRRLVTMEKVAPVPSPAPSRADCAPRKPTDDMRALMDASTLADNEDYTEYRARQQRRREAAHRYHQQQQQQEQQEREGGELRAAPMCEKRRRAKGPGQAEIVANREKNIRIRQEKQEASHRANLERKQQQQSERQEQGEE